MIADPYLVPSHEESEIPALPKGTRMITLENGLVIIIREDPSAPVVSAQAWCKAGSIDEGRWLGAGMSHMLEHMLFKGTSTRGAGRIDQEVQDVGGYMNAYTSFDRTVYWINVPSSGATVAIDILCDIMQNATLPDSEIEKEKQVILREMDMNQDDPSRRASRRLFETAYVRSPYRYTVIGYPDIFNQIGREELYAYYKEKYTPNNTFFVVVGQIKATEVEEQIRKAFATVKARPLAPAVLPLEPTQTAQREVIEEAPIELGHFHFAWHVPDIRHPDIPIIDVLATLLGSGHSSRLYQEVRERLGVAHSVEAWTYNPGNPGLLGISGVVDGNRFDAARSAVLAQIERMKDELVTAAELTKAVKQFTAATLATRKTMQGQAQDFGGNWVATNDLNLSERYLAAVRKITPEQLRQVARKYLTPQNRTLYALLPTGSTLHHAEAAEMIVDSPIQKIDLPNGLRLLVKEDHRLPFVEIRSVFKGGVLAESASNNGLTLLLSKLLLKGTKTRSAEQIANEIESLGGSIDTYGGNNSFGVNSETLSVDFLQGLELVADVILNPSFPETALAREKEVQLASIRAQKDHMLQSASRSMRRALFGQRGYGLDVNGSEETVTGMTVQDLRDFYARVVVPNNCVMAIFGDVKATDVRAAVDRVFRSWAKGVEVLTEVAPPRKPSELTRVAEIRDKKQGVIIIAFPGISIHDRDRFALELLQEALSDLGSRLFVRIRENLGLAYYVGAQHFVGLQPGYFAFYAGTTPEKLDQVEQEMFIEVAALRAEGLTPEELKRAKAKLLGQKKIARQDLGGYAVATALDELYGLGYGNCDVEDSLYEAVTLADIRSAAEKYFRKDSCVVAMVCPSEFGGSGSEDS
ncbi:MAG: Peptidase inactive domain protein [Verrucomicrobiales bacterium]|nr:Peptidase inactive domain protein [Verrucomicrobiales bacterium]